MIGVSTIVHIVLVIVAIAVFSTFIQPTFTELQALQQETNQYREALDNAGVFNQEIDRLSSIANSFSASEIQSLQRYLPETVDQIAVMRDIQTIVELNRMDLDSIASNDTNTIAQIPVVPSQGQEEAVEEEIQSHSFSVTVTGTYEQFKELLKTFERNAYPLELISLGFSTAEGDRYTFTFTLETYSLMNTNL